MHIVLVYVAEIKRSCAFQIFADTTFRVLKATITDFINGDQQVPCAGNVSLHTINLQPP